MHCGDGVGRIGLEGHGRDVVFVVDASGSMIESLPFVIQELRKSIGNLSAPGQRFTVIFYQQGQGHAIELFESRMGIARGLKPASAAIKQRSFQWMGGMSSRVIPQGTSHPLDAFRPAMSYHPDLIIHSFGQYHRPRSLRGRSDGSAVGRVADAGWRGRQIRNNAIQFLYEDPSGTLRDLAQAGGGVKFISGACVGLD